MLLENVLTAENRASAASSVARVHKVSACDELYLLLACVVLFESAINVH
jgi:hypothetical protein